jgi:hypothetical protein
MFEPWTMRSEMVLLALAVIGAILYGIAIGVLFRRDWRNLLQGGAGARPS